MRLAVIISLVLMVSCNADLPRASDQPSTQNEVTQLQKALLLNDGLWRVDLEPDQASSSCEIESSDFYISSVEGLITGHADFSDSYGITGEHDDTDISISLAKSDSGIEELSLIGSFSGQNLASGQFSQLNLSCFGSWSAEKLFEQEKCTSNKTSFEIAAIDTEVLSLPQSLAVGDDATGLQLRLRVSLSGEQIDQIASLRVYLPNQEEAHLYYVIPRYHAEDEALETSQILFGDNSVNESGLKSIPAFDYQIEVVSCNNHLVRQKFNLEKPDGNIATVGDYFVHPSLFFEPQPDSQIKALEVPELYEAAKIGDAFKVDLLLKDERIDRAFFVFSAESEQVGSYLVLADQLETDRRASYTIPFDSIQLNDGYQVADLTSIRVWIYDDPNPIGGYLEWATELVSRSIDIDID